MKNKSHEATNNKPPIGVIMPNIELFVPHNKYNDPENKKTPRRQE
tara:strand:+ start:309 stop:443 length:135 start_codon:yes stop_codon:yes gene_type:complete